MNFLINYVFLVPFVAFFGTILYWSRSAIMNYLTKKHKSISRKALHILLSSEAKWEKVGIVSKLWLYPIKSCAGLNCDQLLIDKHSSKINKCYDRSFMIISEKGNMITGRQIPQTLLIQVSYDGIDTITLCSSNYEPCSINMMGIEEKNWISTKVFKNDVMGYDCGDAVALWLTKVLKKECRLLYHGSKSSIRDTSAFSNEFLLMNNDDHPLYADTISVMLMNTKSIEELSNRVNKKYSGDKSETSKIKVSTPKSELSVQKSELSAQKSELSKQKSELSTQKSEIQTEKSGISTQRSESRAKSVLPAQNFRPNILVDGITSAFDEDEWTYIKIGDVIFRNGMPCTRCIFTTIDFQSAKKDPDMEPLKTLRTYRCSSDSDHPNFGICLGVDKPGSIQCGDDVYVLRD